LFEEWIVLQQQLQGNKLAAGYQLTITLENDSKGNVTGFTFKVVDNYGVTQATWKRTLLSFSYPFFTSADLAPINAFQLVLVGPYGGLSTLLTSGQGTFTLFATNNLTASNSVPAGDLVAGTGEDANSLYTPLPISYPNGEFWQLFTTSTIGPQIHKKGKLVLRKPA
jgi:hypothetical protein